MQRRSVLLAMTAMLFGCATTDSLQPGTGGSTFEVRGKTYDEI
jgi:type IV pilus biogenesis protein CpaD/CtpE